jgi:small subunit ribosomal protein S36
VGPPEQDSPAAAPEPPRPLRLFRTAPKVVWLLVVAHGLLLLSWSVLTPIYHAPDEPVHADAVVRLYDGKGWPKLFDAYLAPDSLSAWAISPFAKPQTPPYRLQNFAQLHLPQAGAIPRAERPPWNQLAETYPLTPPPAPVLQQMVQHPPLYYAIEAGVLKALPGSDGYRWDVWVAIMRIVSVAMMTALPLFAWAACRALTRSRAAALCAALTPFLIPQLSHIGSSVNNDNAVTLFSSLALVGCACALRGNRSLPNAALIGVSLGLALLSKSSAIVLLPIVLAAYLVGRKAPEAGVRPEKRWVFRGSPTIKPLAMSYGLGFVIGGWWPFFQKIRSGHFQPTTVVGVRNPNDPKTVSEGSFLHSLWDYLPVRFWGSPGRYEVSLPFSTTIVASLLVVLLTSYALIRSPGWRARAAVGVMLFSTVALLLLLIETTYSFWQTDGKVHGIQGRYLFPSIVGLAAALGLGVAVLPAKIRRWSPVAFLAAAGYLQFDMIRRCIDTWWRPTHGTLRQAWGSLSAWAAWSPSVVRVIFIVTAVALLAAVAGVVLTCVRRDASPGRRPGELPAATS